MHKLISCLTTPRHSSLPFATKKGIALDIARGLSALHDCGAIHGDMKPENVLIFREPKLHAKIADFSHSSLDTGHARRLVGGTHIYAAPEWKVLATTSELLRTDVYSFGLIFSGLILGSNLIDHTYTDNDHPAFDSGMTREQIIQKLKDDDMMREHLYKLILRADQERPDLHLEEFPMIEAILDSTLQLDPGKRDLGQVVQCLSGRFVPTHVILERGGGC
jgi:serine/threonine protein kinase